MSQPNILLVVLDSVRQDALSCYGNEKKTTPNIDKLAKKGIKFENHFSAAGWTLWSHTAIFSGELPTEAGIDQDSLDTDQTLAEKLREEGYETFGIRTVSHINTERGFDRGFDRYIDAHHDYSRKSLNPNMAVDTVLDRIWGRRHRTFFSHRLLKNQIDISNEPFFGFINYTTAHRPYDAPKILKKKFEDNLDVDETGIKEMMNMSGGEIEEKFAEDEVELTSEDWQQMKNWFYADLYRADFYVGRLVKHLKKTGKYEDTILLVTSDHGDEFGEHNLFTHGYLYDTCLKVPLIIGGGGVEKKEEVEGMTSHEDLPEIIDKVKNSEKLDSLKKSKIWAEDNGRNPETDNEKLRKIKSPAKTVRTSEYKLIKRKYAEDELFNIKKDPEEQNNIIDEEPENAEELEEKLPEFGRDNKESKEPKDEKIKERLEHLGYT